jgi:alpha-ribazole phosphatase
VKLWLLRHARVDLAAGLCYGASDVPAHAELTLAAAQAPAELLPPSAPVWVSALGRARHWRTHCSGCGPTWARPAPTRA